LWTGPTVRVNGYSSTSGADRMSACDMPPPPRLQHVLLPDGLSGRGPCVQPRRRCRAGGRSPGTAPPGAGGQRVRRRATTPSTPPAPTRTAPTATSGQTSPPVRGRSSPDRSSAGAGAGAAGCGSTGSARRGGSGGVLTRGSTGTVVGGSVVGGVVHEPLASASTVVVVVVARIIRCTPGLANARPASTVASAVAVTVAEPGSWLTSQNDVPSVTGPGSGSPCSST